MLFQLPMARFIWRATYFTPGSGRPSMSVCRFPGSAVRPRLRPCVRVAAKLRLDLAQYRELAAFAQFGSELDKSTQMQLTRGERMVEILKQSQFVPLPLARQILIIYCAERGFLDDLPINLIKDFELKFLQYIEKEYPDIEYEIENKKS